MDFASALSRHPVSSQALGEALGSVLEQVGERPDLVVVTVTRSHAGSLEDIVATIPFLGVLLKKDHDVAVALDALNSGRGRR